MTTDRASSLSESHLTIADFHKAAFFSLAAGSLAFASMHQDDLWFLQQDLRGELTVTLNPETGSGVPAMKDQATDPRDMGVRTYGGKLTSGQTDISFSIVRRSDGESLVILTNMRSNVPQPDNVSSHYEDEPTEKYRARLYRASMKEASARNLVVRQIVDGAMHDYPASQGFDSGWSFREETKIAGHLMNLADRDAKKRDTARQVSPEIKVIEGGNRPQRTSLAEGVVDLGLKGVGPVRMRITPSSLATKAGLSTSFALTLQAFDAQGVSLYGENTLFLTQNGDWVLKDEATLEGPQANNTPGLFEKAKRWLLPATKNNVVTLNNASTQKTTAFAKVLLKKLLTIPSLRNASLTNEQIAQSLAAMEEAHPKEPSNKGKGVVSSSQEPVGIQ